MRFTHDCSIRQNIFAPHQRDALGSFKVPKVDLACQERRKVNCETFGRIAGGERLKERAVQDKSFPAVPKQDLRLDQGCFERFREIQNDVRSVLGQKRKTRKLGGIVGKHTPSEDLPRAKGRQIEDI
ncbi:hypothetical protein [Paracoccus sp. PAMC 22219]|uniref:hypothetical protein n=1 Tax=Paracoccus sp. PAMC 22219 TaxID=1569209 RepID=UPI0009DF5971|nr:hypothetical protein [Paracoccus sp. PAMC 22219]